MGIRATLYRAARLFGIHSIIAGTSPRTEANSPDKFFHCSTEYFRRVCGSAFTKQEIHNYAYLGEVKRGIWHLTGTVRWIQLPRYTCWREDRIIDSLSQIGWSGKLWEQHNDCVMSDAKEYLNFRRFGCIEKAAKLSALVRDGQLSRAAALEKLQEEMSLLVVRAPEIEEKLRSTFDLNRHELDDVLRTRHGNYLPRFQPMWKALKRLLYR